MAGFIFHKNQLGLPSREREHIVIAASVTVKWGGLTHIVVSGNPTANNGVVCEDAIAGEVIFGICQGFKTNAGEPLENADTSTFDGTFTDGVLGAKSYAAAADNLTDKQVRASILPLTYWDILRNTPDAAIGTTAGSYTRNNYTDSADDVSIDENNGGNALTTVAQFIIWGRNPDITTEGLYKVKELQDENG